MLTTSGVKREGLELGMFKMFSSCEVSNSEAPTPHSSSKKSSKQPNPNPTNFIIEKIKPIGKFTIVMVRYPDCANYEGRKILVYESISKKQVLELNLLDPHFCEDGKHPSPIARFKPTDQGWGHAVSFCKSVKN